MGSCGEMQLPGTEQEREDLLPFLLSDCLWRFPRVESYWKRASKGAQEIPP